MEEKIIRRCIFRPYPKGKGPVFSLVMWDTHRRDPENSRPYVGYKLYITEPGKKKQVLFTGEDYSPSPQDPIDSDGSVSGLMGFLTTKPGDTDEDYFKDYTPEQLHFCGQWAEDLSAELDARYGYYV